MEFSPFYYFYTRFNLKDNGKEEKEVYGRGQLVNLVFVYCGLEYFLISNRDASV